MATLAMIAAEMGMEAQRRGRSVRSLARGLDLMLVWVGGRKTLRLERPVVAPGEKEVEICRAAFGVPVDAERLDDHNSIELRWEPGQ